MLDSYLVKATNHLDSDVYLFPIGTDKNHLIDCLEEFCKMHRYDRSKTYEFIGDILNSYCFQEHCDFTNRKYIDLSMQEIEFYA